MFRELERELEYELNAQYEVIGADTRVCVSNTSTAPFRYICSLQMDDPAVGPCCTGTLIGPRTLLTAGHCMVPPQCSIDQPHRMRIIPARNGRTRPFGETRAAGGQLAEGFVADSPTDYGVIFLRDPIGNRVGWWTFDHFQWPGDSVGTSVLQSALPSPTSALRPDISGYPCDRPSGPPDPCFVAGQNLTGRRQYQDSNVAVRVTPDGLLEYLNDTFNCMSGSPVWLNQDRTRGGRVMSAVHISGDSAQFPDRANRGVLIRGPVLDFVRAHSFYPTRALLPARPTLRQGARGVVVRELQYRLNVWIVTTPAAGVARLVVDGVFGARTQSAVRAFQHLMGLTVDGVVGQQTWGSLLRGF